jgi:RNA polymerase sigma-70 factor, ECF subfamily
VSKTVTAFESFMREQGPMIYTLAVRLCGNTVEGQDLAQETFVKAYESFDRFRGESAPGTWVYRICVNLWKNRVRYEKRRFFKFHVPWFSHSEEDEQNHELPSKELPMGTQQERVDQQDAVQQALAQLGAEDRALIVLCDMEEKSYEEISELLSVPIGTVKSRISRSRERLRQILKPMMDKIL